MNFAIAALGVCLANAPLSSQISLSARLRGHPVLLEARTLPKRFSSAQASLRPLLQWDTLQPGLAVAEFTVEAGRLGFDVRIIVVRMNPQQFSFLLEHRTRANKMTGAWSVDSVPAEAALAVNAGQFMETGPWGWLVLDGVERRTPETGPLSVGFAIDSTGALRWVPYRQIHAARSDRAIRFAFQSYPLLLFDASIPALARDGRLVDHTHRDARLILAEDSAGDLLIVLTRYDALGAAGARVPIGLTVPESILLVGGLGARHAVMLDGGVSAQLLVRDRFGTPRIWRGMRKVPLAMIAVPRPRK